MIKQLSILLVFIFAISCSENDDNQDGVIDSFASYDDYAYLDLESYLVNKFITTRIEYLDENLSYDNIPFQIRKETNIKINFETLQLNKVIINERFSTLLE